MQNKFNELVANGTLFQVELDRDKVWQIYLDAFPADKKQENTCNCCKSFLRQYGGVVGIKDNQMVTLWDWTTDDPEYAAPIKAVGDYIRSLPIKGVFYNPFAKCGTEKNPDVKRGIIWEHFYIQIPNSCVKKESGPLEATALDSKNVLQRSLTEITDDAVDTVLELIAQGSLYRGNEHQNTVSEFKKLKEKYKKIKNTKHKDNFCWIESAKVGGNVSRIRNTSIGTLLNDLSEGKELDKAVTAFERVVAPTNYKRVTTIATPKMIDAAKARLGELGLIEALNRRMLSERDLSVANVLFVERPRNKESDPFEDLKKGAIINPKTLNKVEEVSIKDFIEKILPTAKSVSALVENNHFGNFATLIGPKNPDSGKLFKWNNQYSWSYSGGVSDSIREKVKAAGGKVEGYLRVSLAWSNGDDLDLHVFQPNREHVYFGNKCGVTGVELDVDMNAGGASNSIDPVENMIWLNQPTKEGIYRVMVNNYNKRSAQNQGFTIEAEVDGETYCWTQANNNAPNKQILEFRYSKKNGVEFLTQNQESGSTKYNSKEKWNVKSGVFQKVKSIVLSPNFWGENRIGNKHFFFMLEGCKTDEAPKPFLNEFLAQSLNKERKTMEMLNSKFIVEKSNDELSGLGFSETVRAELILEVEGSFKRLVRVKF